MKRTPIRRVSAKKAAANALYLEIRREVLTRDRWECRLCGRRAVDTHHILYRSQGGPDERWNLISLCRGCHDMVHSEGPSWRPKLYAIVEAVEATLADPG